MLVLSRIFAATNHRCKRHPPRVRGPAPPDSPRSRLGRQLSHHPREHHDQHVHLTATSAPHARPAAPAGRPTPMHRIRILGPVLAALAVQITSLGEPPTPTPVARPLSRSPPGPTPAPASPSPVPTSNRTKASSFPSARSAATPPSRFPTAAPPSAKAAPSKSNSPASPPPATREPPTSSMPPPSTTANSASASPPPPHTRGAAWLLPRTFS